MLHSICLCGIYIFNVLQRLSLRMHPERLNRRADRHADLVGQVRFWLATECAWNRLAGDLFRGLNLEGLRSFTEVVSCSKQDVESADAVTRAEHPWNCYASQLVLLIVLLCASTKKCNKSLNVG